MKAALADAQLDSARREGLRIGLICASFLGSNAAEAFSALRDGTAEPSLTLAIQQLAVSEALCGPHALLLGTMGASMTALALAVDALRLGRADAVVAFGVETVDAAIAASLGLLRCRDFPDMRPGAAAVVLERDARERVACIRRRLLAVELASPAMGPCVQATLQSEWPGLARLRTTRPKRIEICGGVGRRRSSCAERFTTDASARTRYFD